LSTQLFLQLVLSRGQGVPSSNLAEAAKEIHAKERKGRENYDNPQTKRENGSKAGRIAKAHKPGSEPKRKREKVAQKGKPNQSKRQKKRRSFDESDEDSDEDSGGSSDDEPARRKGSKHKAGIQTFTWEDVGMFILELVLKHLWVNCHWLCLAWAHLVTSLKSR
jgi:hypothetical protein